MKITVALRDAPYDVLIGDGVRRELPDIVSSVAPRAKIAVFVTTPSLRHQPWWDFTLSLPTHVIEIPEGEAAKDLTVVARVCDELARAQVSRHDVLVAVGGGATTDVAGFIAAVYLRGVAVVHVSTTVAGQVDAAIGGKTAVNIPAGKNLVGAFHQPKAVLCDTALLATLPEREYRGGMGEVAKCWLLEARPATALASASLEDFIAMAVQLKASIVARDEFELTGERALLNYGHTLGHAIERLALAVDENLLRHGEAVACGLAFAVRLARQVGLVDGDVVRATDDVVTSFGLALRPPVTFDIEELLEVMARDKKAHHNLVFVLPGPDGFASVTVDADDVRAAYRTYVEETQ